MTWYIAKTLVLMGNYTTKMKHLDDHDHCPPETLMIMKPSMNPNMAPKVGTHFRSLCAFGIMS